jgi:hypothetical protein
LEKHLHIISLTVPYPVNYGGVYDLFYKLPALQQQGIKIHLHCFDKDRGEQPELNKFCEEVFYYKRNTGRKSMASKLPYIVESRTSDILTERLLQNDYPVLMEGVHCTYITNDERFKNREMFVRIHNAEHAYYEKLYEFSRNPKKKMYYWLESKKLYRYEKKLSKNATAFWAAAQQDADYYHKEFNCKNIYYLPLFIPQWNVESLEGMGSYCLYHGNLEVEENEYAIIWLLKNVFKTLDIPFVVAGKNPSKKIISSIKNYANATLVANPDEKQMQDIVLKAHIHVLPSFNNTGIKIKLLNALFNGRHCVANTAMVAETSVKNLCHVVDTANEFKERIQLLYHQPFTAAEKKFRKNFLQAEFSNEDNAKQIVKWIWKV